MLTTGLNGSDELVIANTRLTKCAIGVRTLGFAAIVKWKVIAESLVLKKTWELEGASRERWDHGLGCARGGCMTVDEFMVPFFSPKNIDAY